MAQSGGGGSTTRHIIEVMYQITGLDKAGSGITSMNKSVTQGQTTLDKYGMSATKASQETTKLATSTAKVAPAIDKTSSSTQKLDKSLNSTGDKAKSLGEKFRGNKGLIFSTTMLSSGVFEAIGMFQGWTDASEKLSNAQQKVNDLEARGMENTKEYGDAVRELADAQRGFNFIQRFTIQSFADLIPMSLMMASSLIEMSGNFMKGATMKEKFAAASTKVVGGLKAMGNAMLQFTTRHPLLLLLTLITAAFVAFATNAGGFRDRINEIGVALGNAVPGLKGFLTWLGDLGNGFGQSAEAAMGYSQETTKSLKDVESEVLRTGDATKLSIDEQIAMYGKLGDEAKDVAFSLSTHLKMQQDEQEAHRKKYAEFVTAMESGDQDIMKSMGLTEEQFKEFYKQWEQEISDFDSKFSEHVDKVVENYNKFEEAGRSAQEKTIEDLAQLKQKLVEHYQKREEIRDSDGKNQDEAMDKWEEEEQVILDAIAAIDSGLSDMAMNAAQDWKTFTDSGKAAMDVFRQEALGGNFQAAINAINTAMDNVPDKYKQNMGKARSILDNESLSMEARADIFVAHMDQLDPFQSFVVGAHEYTLAQAQATSSLDELAVSARAGARSTGELDARWKTFVGSLNAEQKALPIVQAAIEGVESGAITTATAFGMVQAAGEKMSAQLGGTVTQTFEDLKKTIITMPDGTQQAFASIGGQVVSLGKVSDGALVSGGKSVTNSLTSAADETDYMAKTFAVQMPKASTEVETFQTDANSFLTGIISTFTSLATEAAKLPAKLKTALDTKTITAAWDAFRNALGESGEWVNQGITKIAGFIKSAVTIEKFKDAWTGFWQAIAEGKDIIVSGIATLATTIASDIKAKALSQEWWKGFWEAMSETVTWVATGIGAIGTEIAKEILASGPTWWKGFQDALASTAQWVGTGITAIGTGITKTIQTQGPKWWVGFQQALASTAQWVGTGITNIGKGITSTIQTQGPKWWVGFQKGLGVVGTWVSTALTNIGNAILDYDWAAIGSGIWTKIVQGITGAFKAGGDFLSQLNPFNFGGADKNPFTEAAFNPNQGKNPIKNDMGGIVGYGGPQQGQPDPKQMSGLLGIIKQVQAAFSALSTSIATYSKSMTANMGIFFTKMGAAFPLLDTMVKTHQATWSGFSTSLLGYATSMTANIGAFFTKMSQAFPLLDQMVKTHQVTWSAFSTSLLAYSTSMTANLGTFFTTISQAFIQLDVAVKTHNATWSAFSTSLATYSTSMTTNLGKFFTTIAQAFIQLDTAVKAHQKTWSTLSTSVSTYSKSMTTNVSNFAKTSAAGLKTLSSAITSTQGAMSKFSTSVASYSKSMASNLKSFSSSAVSSLKAVTSAANSATSALNKMASAAAKAKSARSGLRFGGAFVMGGQPMNQSGFAQTGKSFINSRPRKIGGVNISEFSKPELVTVTPLSNPSDPMDKGLNYLDKLPAPKLQMPDMSNIGGSGNNKGGRQPIHVELHTTISMPDGKVLAKSVQSHLLDGFSGITS
jgi:hypothetical protein